MSHDPAPIILSLIPRDEPDPHRPSAEQEWQAAGRRASRSGRRLLALAERAAAALNGRPR